MGALQSVHDEGQISDEFLEQMHRTIDDAHATSSRHVELVLPWEQPSMQWIFSDADPSDFVMPTVPPVWDYVEPAAETSGARPDSATVICSKATFFEDANYFI